MGAVSLMHRLSLPDFEEAYRLLQALIDRGVRHPLPIAWLGNWHVLRVQQGWSDDPQRDTYLALECTKRALDMEPDNSLALAINGFVHVNLLKKFDVAEESYERALAANPSNAFAWLLKGTLHAFKSEGEPGGRAHRARTVALAARPASLLLRFAGRHCRHLRRPATSARSSWPSARCAPIASTPPRGAP